MTIPKWPLRRRLLQSLIFVAILATTTGYFWWRKAPTGIDRSTKAGVDQRISPADVVRVYTPAQEARLAGHRRSLDPKQDKWRAEELGEAAQAQIKIIADFWINVDSIGANQVLPLVTDDFHCSVLRPRNLHEVYADNSMVVLRPADAQDEVANDGFRVWAGLAEALRDLAQPLAETSLRRTHVKTVTIEDAKTTFTTVHIVEASGQTTSGSVEQHARWHCQWSSLADAAPQLRSIRLDDYEEVVASTPHKTWFTDCTEAVVGHSPAFRQQLTYGLNHWLVRIESNHGMYVFAEYGIGLGDVNGDDLDDVYVCQPAGLPNRLLVRGADGTVTDRSESAGVDWLDHTSSSLFVDLDNDSD